MTRMLKCLYTPGAQGHALWAAKGGAKADGTLVPDSPTPVPRWFPTCQHRNEPLFPPLPFLLFHLLLLLAVSRGKGGLLGALGSRSPGPPSHSLLSAVMVGRCRPSLVSATGTPVCAHPSRYLPPQGNAGPEERRVGGKPVNQSSRAKYYPGCVLSKHYSRERGRLQTQRHRLSIRLAVGNARARVGCGLAAAAAWFPKILVKITKLSEIPPPLLFSFPKDLNVIYTSFRCCSGNQRGRKFPLSCHPCWLMVVFSAKKAVWRVGGKTVFLLLNVLQAEAGEGRLCCRGWEAKPVQVKTHKHFGSACPSYVSPLWCLTHNSPSLTEILEQRTGESHDPIIA